MYKEGPTAYQDPYVDQRQLNQYNYSNINTVNRSDNFGYDSDSNQINTNKNYNSNESRITINNIDKSTKKLDTNSINNTKAKVTQNTNNQSTNNQSTNNNNINKLKKSESTEKEALLKNTIKLDKDEADSLSGPDYVLLDQNQGLKQNKKPKAKKEIQKDEPLKTARNLQIIEAKNKKHNFDMKTKNNQSSFAKNPTQSYSDQYYASLPTAYKLPRGGVIPLVDPYTGAPIPPFMPPYMPPFMPTPYGYPPMFNPYMPPKNPVFYAKKGSPRDQLNYFNSVIPYNYLPRPNFYDDKDPSIHDLLYMDKFKNQDASYSNKHIERKIRAIDGYYNPYGEYTVQDYKNLKSNFGVPDPKEERIEKTERMQKAKEFGNNIMKTKPSKSNRKGYDSDTEQPKKTSIKQAQSDTELPRLKNITKNTNNNNNFKPNNLNQNPYLNQNYNYNSLGQINQQKNYETFDFISSNEGYGFNNNNNNINQNNYNQNGNSNLDTYQPYRYNGNNVNSNSNLYLGYQSEQNLNQTNQNQNGKYFKNPRFDFSKNSQPIDSINNPRARYGQNFKD